MSDANIAVFVIILVSVFFIIGLIILRIVCPCCWKKPCADNNTRTTGIESQQRTAVSGDEYDSDTEDLFLSNLSRAEATAITRMMGRMPRPAVVEVTSPVPIRPSEVETSRNAYTFPMPVIHAPVNDLPPAYEDVVEMDMPPSSKAHLPYANLPEYSVFIISNESLPSAPPEYQVGIR